MANLPRFGWARQRTSAATRPAPAAAQPALEPEPEILPLAPTAQSLQPFEPIPPPAAAPSSSPPREFTPWISSQAKKAPSPAASPKYNATVTRVASPPVSPSRISGRKHLVSPSPYGETVKPTTPPLSPLALPKSANVNTIQAIIQPEVERIASMLKKPAKPDRQTEHSFGKPAQKAEAINLSGHNVGAVMEVKQLSDTRSGGEVIKKIESETGVRHGNDEWKTGAKERSHRATGFPMTQFMNSNFQEVNNSVMYNSSCSGRDPGLHLDYSGKSKDAEAIVDGGKKSKY